MALAMDMFLIINKNVLYKQENPFSKQREKDLILNVWKPAPPPSIQGC